MGGRDATSFLQKLLQLKKPDLRGYVSLIVAERIKEMMTYTSPMFFCEELEEYAQLLQREGDTRASSDCQPLSVSNHPPAETRICRLQFPFHAVRDSQFSSSLSPVCMCVRAVMLRLKLSSCVSEPRQGGC